MGKLYIKDKTTGRTRTFWDTRQGYAQAQNYLDQLNQAGHRVDLSAGKTGKRLQDMQDAKSGFFSRLLS